jgi:hypothetical protein
MPKNKDELRSVFKAVRTFGTLPLPRSIVSLLLTQVREPGKVHLGQKMGPLSDHHIRPSPIFHTVVIDLFPAES